MRIRIEFCRKMKKIINLHTGQLFLAGIFSLLLSSVPIAQSYLYRLLVDDVMIAGKISKLRNFITAMVLVWGIYLLLSIINILAETIYRNKQELCIKKIIFNKILGRNAAFLYKDNIVELKILLEENYKLISDFLILHLKGTIQSLLCALIIVIAMLKINIALAISSIVIIPFILYIIRIISEKFNGFNFKLRKKQGEIDSFLLNTLHKWRDIKILNLEDSFVKKYNDILLSENKIKIRWMKLFAINRFIIVSKNELLQKILIYFIGGILIIYNYITIGELLMFICLLDYFTQMIDVVLDSSVTLNGNRDIYKRIFEILESKEEQGIKCIQGYDIKFNNVSFKYLDSEYILKNFTCTFNYGQKYFVEGRSGGGKSTMVKLLIGILPQYEGNISFGMFKINEISSTVLFDKIAIIMQETEFFNLSIIENFLILKENITKEYIREACRLACIDDFIIGLPQGYNTVIGEHGVKLSGGQKQRLAIARLFILNSEVIILDEATSALDLNTEKKVMKNMFEFFRNKTFIIISHREFGYLNFHKKIIIN